VNPKPVKWNEVMQGIAFSLHKRGIIKTVLPMVTFSDWVENLRSKPNTPKISPAIKLLPFFTAFSEKDGLNRDEAGGRPEFVMENAYQLSEKVQRMREGGTSLMDYIDNWIEFWINRHFL
jgi:hypothetical protein